MKKIIAPLFLIAFSICAVHCTQENDNKIKDINENFIQRRDSLLHLESSLEDSINLLEHENNVIIESDELRKYLSSETIKSSNDLLDKLKNDKIALENKEKSKLKFSQFFLKETKKLLENTDDIEEKMEIIKKRLNMINDEDYIGSLTENDKTTISHWYREIKANSAKQVILRFIELRCIKQRDFDFLDAKDEISIVIHGDPITDSLKMTAADVVKFVTPEDFESGKYNKKGKNIILKPFELMPNSNIQVSIIETDIGSIKDIFSFSIQGNKQKKQTKTKYGNVGKQGKYELLYEIKFAD